MSKVANDDVSMDLLRLRDWENPLVQEKNRLRSSPLKCSFPSTDVARGNVLPCASCNVLILDGGGWAFRLAENPEEAFSWKIWEEWKGVDEDNSKSCCDHSSSNSSSRDSFCASMNNNLEKHTEFHQFRRRHPPGYSRVKVPSCWQLTEAGSNDEPIYTNTEYPFHIDPPRVPMLNPTGSYRLSFRLPDAWIDETGTSLPRMILHFGSVDSCFFVWFNGQFCGFSKDSRLPAEFEVSNSFLNTEEGSNQLLSVMVIKWSDGSYLEDQDMWWLSGIHRSVHLLRLPSEANIETWDWTINSEMPTVVVVKLNVTLHRDECVVELDQTQQPFVVRAEIFEDGIIPPECVIKKHHERSIRDDYPIITKETLTLDSIAHLSLNVESPHLWCPEDPYLYTLVLSLLLPDGRVLQCESARLGFRVVNVNNKGQICVNNKPIMLNGANLHAHHERYGKAVPPETMLCDILLMKRHNINAIRTAHYPQDSLFYELCNAAGLYVIDEANIETHGLQPSPGGRLASDPSWLEAFMLRLTRMWERNHCHPCIIAWSLGNESGYGSHHDAMADWIRNTDPSRLVVYEPASYGRHQATNCPTATDVLFPMYAREKEMLLLLNEQPELPLILCAREVLVRYMTMESLMHLRDYRRGPDRTPHPGLREFKKVGQPFATEIVSATGILVHDNSKICRVDLWIHFNNRYEHIENLLDVLKFDWVAKANGKIVCEGYDLGTDVCDEINSDEAAERRTKWPDVLIAFHVTPISPCSDLVVRITACLRHNLNWASCGYPVGFEELLLTPQIVPEAYDNMSNNTTAAHCYSITSPLWPPEQQANVVEIENHDNEILIMSAGPIEASFNRSNGGLASLRLSGYELLYTAAADNNDLLSPLLNVQLLRAPTDNDRGGYINQWNAVGLSLTNHLQPIGKPSLTWRICDGGTSAILTVHHDLEPTYEDMEKIRILKTMSRFNLISTMSAENNPVVVNSMDLRPPPLILKDLTPSEMRFVYSLISSWRLGFHLESTNSVKVWVKDRTLNSTIQQEGDMDIASIEALLDSLKMPSSDIDNGCSVSHEKTSAQPVRKGHTPTSTRVEIETEYHLNAETGVLRIKCNVNTPTWWPPLPRVGLRLLLGEEYEAVEWFGKGPDECYPDRRSAAYTDIHGPTSVSDLFVPYIQPSENGARTDTRWVIMRSEKEGSTLPGLIFTSDDLFTFSALHHLPEDLQSVLHPEEVLRSPRLFTCLSLDYKHMGVGSDDSWSACIMEKYLVPSGQYNFTFAIQCVESGSTERVTSKDAYAMAFGLRETLVVQKERDENCARHKNTHV